MWLAVMHLPGVVDGEVDVERRAVDGDSLDGSIASQRRVLNRYTLRRNAIQQAGAYSQPSSSSAARRLTGAMFAGTGARWACSPLAAASALVSTPPQGSTAVNNLLRKRPTKWRSTILGCDFQRYLAGPVAVVWLVLCGWKHHLGVVADYLGTTSGPVNRTNHPEQCAGPHRGPRTGPPRVRHRRRSPHPGRRSPAR